MVVACSERPTTCGNENLEIINESKQECTKKKKKVKSFKKQRFTEDLRILKILQEKTEQRRPPNTELDNLGRTKVCEESDVNSLKEA